MHRNKTYLKVDIASTIKITRIGRKTNEGSVEVYAVLLDKCEDADFHYLHIKE